MNSNNKVTLDPATYSAECQELDSRTKAALEARNQYGDRKTDMLGGAATCKVNGFTFGLCPHCGKIMVCGDELFVERCCEACAAEAL